jgi:hypothetical protein
MTNNQRLSTGKSLFITRLEENYALLDWLFCSICKDATSSDFQAELVIPILLDRSCTGQYFYEFMEELALYKTVEEIYATEDLPVIYAFCAAVAFLVEAQRSFEKDNPNDAWDCLGNSRFFAGTLSANLGSRRFAPFAFRQMRLSISRKGGRSGKNAQRRLAKAEAQRLAQEFCKNRERKFPTQNSVALAIESDLKRFIAGLNPPLEISAERITKTINGWLASMPNADQLFRPKRSTGTSKKSETSVN